MTVMRARSLNGPTPDSSTANTPAFIPPPIARVEDTGLSYLWLQDLALKTLYFKGYPSGFQIAEDLALPFQGVVDGLLETLKRDKLVEIKSSQAMGLGEGAYIYGITGLGIARAAAPPQLLQLQVGVRLHADQRAVGQAYGDERVRRHLQARTLVQGLAGPQRRGAGARRGRGARLSVHEIHLGGARGQQLGRDAQHRARPQPAGIGHMVVGLQLRPQPRGVQVAYGQGLQRVTRPHQVFEVLCRGICAPVGCCGPDGQRHGGCVAYRRPSCL